MEDRMNTKRRIDGKGPRNLLYPYLPVLVGTEVHGKPNYMTIGLIGWICYDTISISVGHRQYSKEGIEAAGTFSVNQPTLELLEKLDYCGLHSGRDVDKAALFESFYGVLATAPMICECPINIECRVVQTIERPIHKVFLGEVAAVHASERVLSDDVPDIERIAPVFYGPDRRPGRRGVGYWSLGEYVGSAFEIGKSLEPEE
jgi:flavin reductase (DIM6/NTAB) family NADH-FMN oxidoreductase RutF